MNTKNIGSKGEQIASIFIERKGFKVIGHNYRKTWGEIDIIAEKEGTPHFFEVKSIVVSYIEPNSQSHRPEDNVHGLKRKHIGRMIETYLEETKRGLDSAFYFHVLCVYLSPSTKRARVKWIKNIIL